jgi:hypothetical protein
MFGRRRSMRVENAAVVRHLLGRASLQHPTRTYSGELAEPSLHAGILVTLVSLGFMLHAAKTGRFMPWFYIILFLPGIGAMAYVVVELLPEWFGSSRAQRARNNISTTLNPAGRYRQLRDELSVVDTIANRAALAEECLRLGKFEEALGQYDAILAKPLGDEPSFMLGKARAQFGLGQAAEAVATLEALKATWPNYQSSEEQLLLAMALEGAGRDAEALAQYEAASLHYPGPEPRVRRAELLRRLGRAAEARAIAEDVVRDLRRAPAHVRRDQRDWLASAQRVARG